MSLFLIQPRGLKFVSGDKSISFPASVTAKVTFKPEDAFGLPGAFLRTTIPLGIVGTRISWDSNEGVVWLEGETIPPLEEKFEFGRFCMSLEGNQLTLVFDAESLDEVITVSASANTFLPPLLSFHLGIFVWIKFFEIDIEDSVFIFQVPQEVSRFFVTTAERNGAEIVKAVEEWFTMADMDNQIECRRLVSALYYFRQAQRFASLQPIRQSMAAEVLLNLTKALEIFFSSDREQIRIKAGQWGFDKTFVEEKIIPLFLLRNQMDVAHVATAPLDDSQRQTILEFTDKALSNVHYVLERVAELVKSDKARLKPTSDSLDRERLKLIGAIETYLAQ